MSHVILITWHVGEAEQRAGSLRRAGHRVDVLSPRGAADLKSVRKAPPHAFVIDLSRRPSDGPAIAIMLRQLAATRRVPIVLAGGDRSKVARARRLLPDAVFTEWSRVRGALRQSIRNPPADPVVPGTMDAYSGTPLAKKLGIRTGSAVVLLGAPPGFECQLGALPEGARLKRQGRGDVTVLFTRSRADFNRRFPARARATSEGERLWIAWPKQTSSLATDLTLNIVRAVGLDQGLVDFKICAIDDTWSGLCFTRRRARR
jgi:hypothetical protein